MSLKILFATPEYAPWVKTGGLGDVSGALPPALAALGHEVLVLVPAYEALFADLSERTPVLALPARDGWPAAQLSTARQPGGVTLLLLECPELYGQPGGPYLDAQGRDHPHNARRFAFLSHVAALLSSDRSPWTGWQPDILHCHDWTCGLAPFYLHLARRDGATTAASVMTIHNLAFQGLFPLHEAGALGIPPAWQGVDGVEYWGQLSMLKAGLLFCDAITTVSPTYAREIRTEALGMGLHGVLQARADRLHGILNGVDTSIWNPATDALLPHRFRPDALWGKAVCKGALQRECGLAERPDALLLALVGRLTAQKGIDLVVAALPWIVAQGAQLVVLGQGDAPLQDALRAAAAAHPRQVHVHVGFSELQAHRIEAGADAFLMPSRYEPCGLNQMYSQLYGTPPLVHATGGLADSVVDLAAGADRATGVVIDDATPAALVDGLERLQAAFRDPPLWRALQRNGMASGFGWQDSARAYDAVFAPLAAARRAKAQPA
ncbi:glycogen synthase GlgA [uncultured Xylophilus sp.]|uniref:glycogen synthase GlgA n=1 Tax=uncultured Xylophilus sp. TaxID=296832 RepID=UPI0025CED6F5|nr:glycogen synthase GlgA [uncultured Xylophilus sp.]